MQVITLRYIGTYGTSSRQFVFYEEKISTTKGFILKSKKDYMLWFKYYYHVHKCVLSLKYLNLTYVLLLNIDIKLSLKGNKVTELLVYYFIQYNIMCKTKR